MHHRNSLRDFNRHDFSGHIHLIHSNICAYTSLFLQNLIQTFRFHYLFVINIQQFLHISQVLIISLNSFFLHIQNITRIILIEYKSLIFALRADFQGKSFLSSLKTNLRNLTIFGKGEFLFDAFCVWHPVYILEHQTKLFSATFNMLLLIPSHSHQDIRPYLLHPSYFVDQVYPGCGQKTWFIFEKVHVQKHQLQNVLGKVNVLRGHIDELYKRLHKLHRVVHYQVEFQSQKDIGLEFKHIAFRESVGREMNELLYLWNVVSLFVLCSYEESCGSKQLQTFLTHLFLHEVLVDNHNHGEQSFREHFESQVQIDKPVDENASHVGFDLFLLRHIVNEIILFILLREHMREARFEVFRNHLDILEVSSLGLLLFRVYGGQLGRFVGGFFYEFWLKLLITEPPVLAIDMGDEWLVFDIVGVFFIDDVGEFFPEESVERLHGSIGEQQIIIFLTDKYIVDYHYQKVSHGINSAYVYTKTKVKLLHLNVNWLIWFEKKQKILLF